MRFLHICHEQKFEISPHDRFVSAGTARGAREKYQVCTKGVKVGVLFGPSGAQTARHMVYVGLHALTQKCDQLIRFLEPV